MMLSRWQWFNNIMSNVKLTKKQWTTFFDNMSDEEVSVWSKEVAEAYPDETVKTREDLVRIYVEYPLED